MLWPVGLVLAICCSMADSVALDRVAYERDTTVFYYPLMRWVGERLRAGELPLWTPQMFGGYPIFADGEIGLAYPPTLLALWLLPTDAALILLRLVHLCLAGLGMYAFVRAWRLPRPSAATAGLVFTLGNFFSAQIQHENIVRTVSWLPLVLTCTEYALQASTWPRRWRWILGGAIALGLAGIALHSQMLAVELLILVLYGLFRVVVSGPGEPPPENWRAWPTRLREVVLVGGGVVLPGFALAAIEIVPLLELARFSPRGSGLSYSDAAAYSLTPYGLIQLVFPYVFRGPDHVQWGLWTHWESYLYIGLAPLILSVVAIACRRGREVWGWVAVGGLGVVIALGQYSVVNLHYVLWLLPGMGGLRAPGRFTLITVLAGAMLTAYGLAWLDGIALNEGGAERPRVRRLLIRLGRALAALVVGLMLVHITVWVWPDAVRAVVEVAYLKLPRDSYPLTANMVLNGLSWWTDLRNARTTGAVLGLAIVLAWIWLWVARPVSAPSHRLGRWAPVALFAATAIDLIAFTVAIHPREDLHVLGVEPPAVTAIAAEPSVDGAPHRILASPVLNQVAVDRLAPLPSIQDANGYSSLQFRWHRDYLNRVLYADDALLDLWNVRYVIDPAQYGTVLTYKDVSYLRQQVLSHGPAGSSLSEQQFALAPGSRVTELRFVSALMGAVGVAQGTPVARFDLLDDAGRVVGTAELQAGRDSMDWAAALASVRDHIRHQPVEVAGTAYEGASSPQNERQLSFADVVFSEPIAARTLVLHTTLPEGELALYGGAVVNEDGSAQQLFGRTKTRYRPLYADREMRVLENVSALPRAFVVPRAQLASSLGTALSDMVHRPFAPDREIILAADQGATLTASDGVGAAAGTATISSYSAGEVRVRTSTAGEGWLVLSDTYYPGWEATVDGQSTPILRGDVLFRAIRLPAGEHDVVFHFDPASIRAGLAISIATLVLVACGLVVTSFRRSERVFGC